MTRLRAAWERVWFAPGDPRTLALARIVVATHALWILLSRDLPALSGLPAPFWRTVTASARARFLIAEGHPRLEALLALLAAVSLVAVGLGLWTRVSGLLAGLLLYHLAPLETIILTPSPYVKGFTVAVPALVVLSLAPCADAWSVRRTRTAAAAWEYHWPVQLIRLFVAQIYLFSGWAKLVRVGVDWAAADNVRAWLYFFNQRDQLVVYNSLGPWLAERPALCLAAGVFTLCLELSFVSALLWRAAREVLPLAAAAWHVGILFAMNIAFPYLPLLLVFAEPRQRQEPAGT
jgi:hypothetical protein